MSSPRRSCDVTRVTGVTIVLLLTLLAAACGEDEPLDIGWRSLPWDGRERTYVVRVPPEETRQSPMPLVIVLHAGASNAGGVERVTGFTGKGAAEGFVVVYPNGTGPLGDSILAWNGGTCCGYALDNDVDDIGFLRVLIDEVMSQYPIDERAVYVTGISNGGMLAYRAACELSNVIAAVGPVAGALNVECSPSEPVSVVAFHGATDEYVEYEGGPPAEAVDLNPRSDASVAESTGFWVEWNDCQAEPERHTSGSVIVDDYVGCRDGTAVRLYTIAGGGHVWPAKAPVATDEMWQFFSAHRKP